MSREIDAKQKKQAFAINTLLPFFISQVESAQGNNSYTKMITDRMAQMKIFPYITATGTMYGSLSEPGISWYYCKDKKYANTKSTQSYRILDGKQFNQALFDKVLFIFGKQQLIREYTDEAVRSALITKMGKQTEYSDLWWKYAIDAFKLWNKKEDLGTRLREATQNINNSYFLFDEDYCEPEFRKLLEANLIYKDIRHTSGFKKYMSSNPEGKEKEKFAFLEYLGVPSKFIRREGYNVWYPDDRIVEVFNLVGKCSFPVQSSNALYFERCRLSEYVFQKIYDSDRYSAEKLLNQEDTEKGIVLRNINGAYISCQYSLFYSEDQQKRALEQSRLNMFLIQPERYASDMLQRLAQNVNDINNYDDYNFGGFNIKRIDFYKWAWQFTTNKALLENIINYLNKLRYTEKKDQEFVLDVLDKACGVEYDDSGLFIPHYILVSIKKPFTLNLEADTGNIIKHRQTMNALYKEKQCDVSVCIPHPQFLNKIPDLNEIKKRIIGEVRRIVPGRASEIERDSVWDKIYLAEDDLYSADTYGSYVRIFQLDKKRKIERTIILVTKHEDSGSYIKAISNYIADEYGIILSDITIDWKKEYGLLVECVEEFISDQKQEIKSDDYINHPISYMDDVSTLEQEMEIWGRLKDEKERILNNRVSEKYFEGWRQFLNTRYNGRCQLCGERTVTGKDRSHFWTYRIAKEKENALANISANLFCLCPTCHGALSYGFKGRDLTSIKMKARDYVRQLEICLEEEPDDADTTESIIGDFADMTNDYGEFHMPIVCEVTVNGDSFPMKFSWEHFMQIAFLLKQAEYPG